jgi:Fimbrial assembly protein (PilN)
MAHHLNLLDAGFDVRREMAGSTVAAAALASALLVLGLAAAGLDVLGRRAAERAVTLEQATQALALQPVAISTGAASAQAAAQLVEQQRLVALEAAQQQLRHAIDTGLAGPQPHYSDYLLALSRQTRSDLWLTGFSVAADGRSLDLAGRMTDPAQLTEYLRRLNEEPLFKGREFAELSLKATPQDAGAPAADPAATEFVLRSQPRAAKDVP